MYNAAMGNTLDRLTLGFVLGSSDDGGYLYRVPLLREFLLEDDMGQRLQNEEAACRQAWLENPAIT